MKAKSKILLIGLLAILSNYGSAQYATTVQEDQFTKVLLFKWKESASADEKEELKELFRKLCAETQGCRLQIEDVKSEKFDIALFLVFASTHHEEKYKAHALHQQIIELAPARIDDFLEFQY